MSQNELLAHVDRSLAGLKDFQNATVKAVYRQLFDSNQRSMLIADEVGLGETIVARGCIARMGQERTQRGVQEPLRVTYICSNQVIAQENVRKLNLFPSSVHMKKPVSRISFLAWEDDGGVEEGKTGQQLLELNSLTPATSFEVQRSSGLMAERATIYGLLCQYTAMQRRSNGLMWMLRGGVEKMKRFKRCLERACDWAYQPRLAREYTDALKSQMLPLELTSVYEHLRGGKERTIYQAVLGFARAVDGRNEHRLHRGCLELIYALRRVLIECCLKYVDADLYILDEFQRFRDLIDRNSDQEQAVLARKVFNAKDNSKILMLSATPFKAFTSHDDLDRGEDHHQDFRKVLEFLFGDDTQSLQTYDRRRQDLYKQLLNLDKESLDTSTEHRDKLQDILRRVMCRTERNSVADDPAGMIDDQWREPVPLTLGDIENFRQTDKISIAMDKLQSQIGKPVEYCKSAVFPLSYLDHYQFKEIVRKNLNEPELQAALESAAGAWLDFDAIEDYSANFSEKNGATVSHSRLQTVIEKAFDEKGAELLWVPPSLPYYTLEGSFAGSRRFSKTLLFSAWVMAPRVMGTLISYEAERRTVGQESTREPAEKEPRRYFTVEGERRRPAPRLVYARENREQNHRPRNMSNLCLLYPSRTLTGVVDPLANLADKRSLTDLKRAAANRIQNLLQRADLSHFEQTGGDSLRWYWATPLLLDRANVEFTEELEAWLEPPQSWEPWFRKTNFWVEPSKSSAAKESHFEHFREAYHDPMAIGLGAMPENLAEVLAELATGSPAILTLRSLRRLFPEQPLPRAMVSAFDVADQFVNLFNKPEPIAAVRLGTRKASYWRMVAGYCANGCLQSVLDEYFHVLKGQSVDVEGAILQLWNSVNLPTSSINVDSLETFREGTPKKMRCHYAVEFGSQRIETESGGHRASSLREVFNSPFRPFVLATTSIGQEGLDFHSYCRRIVHWNLPGNPVDLEQREGRINRYKGLVIRQIIAEKYGASVSQHEDFHRSDIWEQMFQLAGKEERAAANKCELTPYWHLETDDIRIERVIPLYPYSSDHAKLNKLLKTLTVYRLAFGQPRQAELVEHLLHNNFNDEQLKRILSNLMIDLCPINYESLIIQ